MASSLQTIMTPARTIKIPWRKLGWAVWVIMMLSGMGVSLSQPLLQKTQEAEEGQHPTSMSSDEDIQDAIVGNNKVIDLHVMAVAKTQADRDEQGRQSKTIQEQQTKQRSSSSSPASSLQKEDHSVSTTVARNLNQRHAFMAQTSETGRRIHHRMAHIAVHWNKDADDADDAQSDSPKMVDEDGDEYPYGLWVKDHDTHTTDNNGDDDMDSLFDFQYFHGKEYQDRASRDFRHSFAGMKLHVFQNQQQVERASQKEDERAGDDGSPLISTTKKLPLHQESGTSTTTSAARRDGDNTNSEFIFDTAYELMEPMHLELGIPPKHYSDYAYTPVYYDSHYQNHPQYHHHNLLGGEGGGETSALPLITDSRFTSSRLSQQRVRPYSSASTTKPTAVPAGISITSCTEEEKDDTCLVIREGTDLEQLEDNCKAIETDYQHHHGADSQDTWWKWWFSFTNPWWRSSGDAKQSEYTMGHTAFAGGSHGQVWKGRRVCHHPFRGADSDGEKHSRWQGTTEFSFEEATCDEDKPLILKRLKVEQGYRLLEAGLREIHFGQWIQRLAEDSEKDLFTTYVDHFFRDLPRASFGSTSSTSDLELWIVFEDAGPSLRNYMYAPVVSAGGFVMYQHSPLWTQLRMTSRDYSQFQQRQTAHYDEYATEEDSIEILHSHADDEKSGSANRTESDSDKSIPNVGRQILRSVLRQILSAAAVLHEGGIVHRDIKPSNVMCMSDVPLDDLYSLDRLPHIQCRLGDFSSAWDQYSDENLYTKGPSPGEQTDEYAPPEAYIDPHWVPFDNRRPQSYDSWSIGVLALELLLGTPNVFSVDQRTTVLLTSKMKKEGASDEELQRALYLAALSQFCIYVPNSTNKQHQASWPYRHGDPLHKTAMAKDSCTLQDFHRALRARDPLGIGFDSSTDLLLHLIWQLVAWDPMERITAAEALQHPFFLSPDGTRESLDFVPGRHNALESQMLDPRLDFTVDDNVQEFVCPKCGRAFTDWHSCIRHATTRRHAKFCTYDRRNLPTCINTHSMLPAHPTSGYCDLQGRRLTIEDFHSIHLYPEIQFYGMFDGHTGNVASKYAASTLFDRLVRHLPGLQEVAREDGSNDWKAGVEKNVSQAFQETHEGFLEALALAPTMDQSGTTATALLVTDDVIVLSSLGDSRAVLSSTDANGRLSAIQLTNDHVASDPHERALVLERGGSVSSSSGGLDRVNGTLAITRSIGDAALAPMLSRKPHVTSMKRDEIHKLCGTLRKDLPCFVVLASDGLWDVMSNQEAVDMVAEVVADYDSTDRVSWNNGGAFQEAAEVLAVDAFVRGSTDNIGVCVVALVE